MSYKAPKRALQLTSPTPERGRRPDAARDIANDEAVDSWYRVASLWEVTSTSGLDRPHFRVDARVLRRGLQESGYPELPIDVDHVVAVADLPSVHRDAFDPLLVAQARTEGLTLLTD